MKKDHLFFLVVLFLFGFTINAIAQRSGEVSYTAILESQDFKELEAVLVFDGDKSLFFFTTDTVLDEKDDRSVNLSDPSNAKFEFSIGEPLASYHEIYIDRDKKEVISSERYFENGTQHPCVTMESTGIFNWHITDEHKEIGSFISIKANTSFRGRNYSAWFTTEIPINVGPWKFHGLPGLILEVYDEEMGVQFLLSALEIPQEPEIKIVPPNEGKHLLIEEYAAYQNNFVEELIESIRAKLPRDAEISEISTSQVNTGIEREY